jgi:hypothetical protein
VYLYASSLYSSNPEIGQRAAAEATRDKFKLEKFSHSTVCRSFRSFEQARKPALRKRFGEELKAVGADAPVLVGAATKGTADKGKAPQPEGRFPSAAGTASRREEMASFFPKLHHKKTADIESIICQFVKNWHEKTRRLLL